MDFNFPPGGRSYEIPSRFVSTNYPYGGGDLPRTYRRSPAFFGRPKASSPTPFLLPLYASAPCPQAPAPIPELPPPVPEDLYRASVTNLRDFTPDLLTHMAAAETGRLVFRNVAPAQVDDWLRRYPEVRENADFRYEYDSLTQRFMVKCSPCAVHESFSIFFKTDVILGMAAKLGSKTVKKILQVSSGSAFSGFSSEYSADSEKLPDAFVKLVGATHPSVVVETGWAEKMGDLRKDAKIWLCGTKGVTKVVIVVCFTEGKDQDEIQKHPGESADAKDEAGNDNTGPPTLPEDPAEPRSSQTPNIVPVQDIPVDSPRSATESPESVLIASITKATLFPDPVESLQTLHSARHLKKPLLGPVTATLHLFRANTPATSIVEFYATSVLPPGDASFELSYADILTPLLATELGLDPEDVLQFDTEELREVIKAQMAVMVLERARRRAKALMVRFDVWEKVETFASSKRRRATESGEGFGEKRKK